jgi:hypothetical protein
MQNYCKNCEELGTLYIVGIIRRFCDDCFERITHLVKAPMLSLVLCFWVSEKNNAIKDKDRPRCSCEQREPKGHRSMWVQGANCRDKNFREPCVNLT